MNLLSETIQAIAESCHTPEQIIFIGSEISGHRCTWEEFQILANREYDNGYGYGGQKVARDLVVVFIDGSKLEREGYDGSEWWRFSEPFEMPPDAKQISDLFACGHSENDLAKINGG